MDKPGFPLMAIPVLPATNRVNDLPEAIVELRHEIELDKASWFAAVSGDPGWSRQTG